MLAAVPLGMWWARSHQVVESVGDRSAVSADADPSPVGAYAEPQAGGVDAAQQAPAAPRRVSIPRLDVQAPVLPVGLDRARAVAIPDDITRVGWYELGVPPGAYRGSAVLVGHRDGRDQGRGVFYDLGRLDVGDRITVTNAADQALHYRVVAREEFTKELLPFGELFAIDGAPRLTLISCGGYYDPNNGGYQDNIVVTAVADSGYRK